MKSLKLKLLTSILTILASPLLALAQPPSALSISTENNAQIQDHGYHDFGRVFVNQRVSARFTITNTGDTELVFKKATVAGMAFDATHSCSNGLKPQEKCSVTIYFWPPFDQWYTGQFVLSFVNDQVIIDLSGTGIKQF